MGRIMIKFSKPKEGEIRYLAFQDSAKKHFWLQKVKIIYAGRRWYQGKILEFIAGEHEIGDEEEMRTGQYPYFCFLETESDAKKLLVLNTFDTRQITIFFHDEPNLEGLI